MKKIAAAVRSLFAKDNGPTTTQMAMGVETGQIQGLRLIKKIPVFGNMSFKEQYKVLGVLWVPSVAAALIAITLGTVMSGYNSKRIERSTQLEMYSQRIARLVSEAALSGSATEIKELDAAKKVVDMHIKDMREGTSGLAKTSGTPANALKEINDEWSSSRVDVENIVNSATLLQDVHETLSFIKDSATTADEVLDKVRALNMQRQANSGTTALIEALSISLVDAYRIADALDTTIVISEESIPALVRAAKISNESIDILLKGSEKFGIEPMTDAGSIERLSSLKITLSSFVNMSKVAETIFKARDAKLSANKLISTSDELLKDAQALTAAYTDEQAGITFTYTIAILGALLSVLIGLFFVWLKLQETKLSAAQIEESIMNLMNDMMDISDGNLALRARVAENITGSIADSLNLTVSRLNQTITGVKDTSTQVLDKTNRVNDEAQLILGAVQLQADKIKQASSMVNSISDSVQAVAFAAEQSAEVAQEQMSATTEGRAAVDEAKVAMVSIRDQIQDTAKRIKRLGESAQEIDEIIELISDTTEQTNVLAMNASIQAAAAGEAGRGFRAVATEVQRLAERSDSSLKRIVALIRAIQADTQNAVAAMERSTQQVVNGAQVTEQAGSVFLKIEDVSRQLQELISDISVATQSQSEEARSITANMTEILSIADNTASGVEEATSGINNISKLAEDLDESMGQFKLS